MSALTGRLGQEGEIRVALEMAALDRSLYHDIHNVTLLGQDGTTQIDHVVISRFGVFVVETKNFAGRIEGGERDARWLRVHQGRETWFQNPLLQNYRHIKALAAFYALPELYFHSVVAFTGTVEFTSPMPENVLRSGFADYVRSKRDRWFSDSKVNGLVQSLRKRMLPRGEDTDRRHIAALRARHGAGRQPQLALWRQ